MVTKQVLPLTHPQIIVNRFWCSDCQSIQTPKGLCRGQCQLDGPTWKPGICLPNHSQAWHPATGTRHNPRTHANCTLCLFDNFTAFAQCRCAAFTKQGTNHAVVHQKAARSSCCPASCGQPPPWCFIPPMNQCKCSGDEPQLLSYSAPKNGDLPFSRSCT